MKYFLITILFSQLCFSQHKINPKFQAKLKNLLRGDIQSITVVELQKNKTDYMILDAREKPEFNVSHIPGAKYIGYKKFELKKVSQWLPRGKKIILYCSVGYRSEIVARKLKANGYKVFNLLGGIFEWSNHGYQLIDKNGAKTSKIHTYNQNWGKWVEKGEKIH